MTGRARRIGGAVAFGLLLAAPDVAAGSGADGAAVPLLSAAEATARCTRLAGQTIGGARIDRSDYVAAGATLAPFTDKLTTEFCRVYATMPSGPGARVKIQIWLPTQWNGKLFGAGGGGFEGGYASASIGLRRPLAGGFAAVATDAGHDANPEPRWALNNSEGLVDYGNRANHLGAVVAKAVVADFYGTAASKAYFEGCSNGGRDALMLAQRYPRDYDAIIAGAPANNFTGLMTSFVRVQRLVAAPGIDLSAAKLALVHDAVLKQCDRRDGLADGLIANPRACRFDPGVLECKSGAGASCLSSNEVAAVRAIYRGTYSRTGRMILPGYAIGSEYGWAEWQTTPKAYGPVMGRQFFQDMVYADPAWTPADFDEGRAAADARGKVGADIDATNPDLRPFFRNGGKLLMYHGWDDSAIPAQNTLDYYKAMQRASGTLAARQSRLFLLPGVIHCLGGNGPSAIDYLAALDQWSSSARAPDRLVATKPESTYRAMAGLQTKSLMTRPICAFPKAARYAGKGDANDPANYVCAPAS